MANTFYYKIVGDTMFYSDINEDGTWTEGRLDRDGTTIEPLKYARPYKEGMAIPYDAETPGDWARNPFCHNTYEEIDFSGFDCTRTNPLGLLFRYNPKLKRIIFGNHLPRSKGDYLETIFTGCGGPEAEELIVEGTVTLNSNTLGQWFKYSNYKSIKFKNFIVNYSGAWGFDDLAFYYNNNLKSIDFSGVETTGQFNNLYCQDLALELLVLPSYSKTRSTYNGVFNHLSIGVDTLTIKGDLTGLKNFAGMFSNIGSNVLDISALKYDDDINNLNMAFRDMNCTTIYATKNIYNGQSIIGGGNPPFAGCPNLVGGNGSKPSTYGAGVQYARIDGSENPGYFTMGTPEYNCVVDIIPAEAATIEWRQERDEFTFSIVSNPGYTFNYFYYKTPGGEYGEKVKNINQCRIPITDGGTYIAYFRYQKTGENPYDPNNPGGGTVPIDDLPSDNTPVETGIDKIEDMLGSFSTYGGNRGVYKIYTPTAEQFQVWMTQLYSENVFQAIQNIVKNVNVIQDMIMGYHILPVAIPKDGTQAPTFNMAGDVLNALFNTVSFDYTNKKTVNFSLGSIKIDRVWFNHLDYSPYTSIDLYLPFIGSRKLDNDDVMGKTIQIDYQIELLTGNCTAYIKVNGQVHYQFTGNCLYKIPLASGDGDVFKESATNALNSYFSTEGGIMEFLKDKDTISSLKIAGGILKDASSTKPMAGPHSSSVQGNPSFNNLNYAYITITRRVPDIPTSYGHNYGFPCNKTVKLEDLTGYTEVESIHLDGLPYTDEELKELEGIMKGGFII